MSDKDTSEVDLRMLMAENMLCLRSLPPEALFEIGHQSVNNAVKELARSLQVRLEGITPSLTYYFIARMMPDADARTLGNTGEQLQQIIIDALTGLVRSQTAICTITFIYLRLDELDDTHGHSVIIEAGGKQLKRLITARRRVQFRHLYALDGDTLNVSIVDIQEEMMAAIKDRHLIVEGIPQHGFESIIGHADAITRLRAVSTMLRGDAEIAPPRAILLTGPPGTGKTATAKALAAEAGIPVAKASASDLISNVQGATASYIRRIFESCEKYAYPYSILIIDEIDSLCNDREAVTELLTCIQGLHHHEHVIVVGTTNRPESLDKALARRFDVKITFELPNSTEREAILSHYLAQYQIEGSIRLDQLARIASRLSGAVLQDTVSDARRLAYMLGRTEIREDDLRNAIENVLFGESSSLALSAEEALKVYAYHEAGHAIALVKLCRRSPQELVGLSLVQKRDIGGVLFRDAKDPILSLEDLVDLIAVQYGGILAEKIFLGIESAGGMSDWDHAVTLAEHLVLNHAYQMGGVIVGDGNGYRPYVDEETRRRAAKEVVVLQERQYERCRKLLENETNAIRKVAEALLIQERLSGEEVLTIIKEAALLDVTCEGEGHAAAL